MAAAMIEVAATFESAEVRRAGRCACCGREIDSRRLWEAVTYRTTGTEGDSGNGQVVQVHQTCAGVVTRGKIGGGTKIVRAPDITVLVRARVLHDA